MVAKLSAIYMDCNNNDNITEIRILGRDLERFGFYHGTAVMISIEHGRIVITPIQKEGACYE
jgi:hypothetical protein